jgi:hypothetical protein
MPTGLHLQLSQHEWQHFLREKRDCLTDAKELGSVCVFIFAMRVLGYQRTSSLLTPGDLAASYPRAVSQLRRSALKLSHRETVIKQCPPFTTLRAGLAPDAS